MSFSRLVLAPLLVCAPLAAAAQDDSAIAALYDALHLPEVVTTMAAEGIAYGDTIAADLFDGAAPPDWDRAVTAIYDPAWMESQVKAGLAAALDGQDLAPVMRFLTSEPGATLVLLESSARAALLDDEIETAAKEAAAVALADETPRVALVRQFLEVNDLIDSNVVAAMNGNYAFYLGLQQGGALPPGMTEDQILQEVWSQEAQIRVNTTEWLYAFLLMAYAPVTDADLQAYVTFSQTAPGAQLNRAVFTAFDGMFTEISLRLGLASSRYMATQEL